jgi:hypothetical protein
MDSGRDAVKSGMGAVNDREFVTAVEYRIEDEVP